MSDAQSPHTADNSEAAAYQQLAVRCRHAIYTIRTGLELIKARQQSVSSSPEVVGMMDRESRCLTELMEALIREVRRHSESAPRRSG